MPFCGENCVVLRGWKVIQVCNMNKPMAKAIKLIGSNTSESVLYQTSRVQFSHFLRRIVY
jgi:hypothetical protein